MTTMKRRILETAAAAAILLTAAGGASGTQTKVWETSTQAEMAEGTFEGTQADSTGELSMGLETLRAELPEAGAVWAGLEVDGTVYLGTGNEGALYSLEGDRLVKLTTTDAIALVSLATDGKGTLFAGALPGGAIYRFTKEDLAQMAKKALSGAAQVKWEPGKTPSEKEKKKKDAEAKEKAKEEGKKEELKKEEGKKDAGGEAKQEPKKDEKKGPAAWATLEGADHVWALAWDEKKKTLYAGTGPEGNVYAVDGTGRATILADTEEEHVLSLALMPDGALLAGTANSARVLRIEGPGRVETLWDFDGTEVKALGLVERGGGAAPAIVAAVNTFKNPPKMPVKMPSTKDLSSMPAGKSSMAEIPEGEGLVAAILPEGGYRELASDKKTHLTSLRVAGGKVQVSTGSGGRVLEVDLEGKSTVILDVGERQVLTFALGGKTGFVGTSDPAAVHRILAGPPSDPLYISKVFDAGFPARWGRFVLRGEGAISWQTRSGNTKEPDETWSAWSTAGKDWEGKVGSPDARFIQYRLRIEGKTRVWNSQLFYLPMNQQAMVTEIVIEEPSLKPPAPGASKSTAHSAQVTIKWKVVNADADTLEYELWFAREGSDQWIDMRPEGEPLTKTEHTWDTSSIPAGHYLVKVVAKDDVVNDPALALSHSLVSHPLLVDNDPPSLDLAVKAAKGSSRIQGSVEDAMSEITRIEYSVDGSPFETLFPEDLIFDEKKETFSYSIEGLEKGGHTVTVRATDRRENQTSQGASFTVK